MLLAALMAALAAAAVCGDGKLDDGEQCDDGNTRNGDGCDSDCRTEVLPPSCGNGIVEAGEDCDDGNRRDDDGCSATCHLETQATCVIECEDDEEP